MRGPCCNKYTWIVENLLLVTLRKFNDVQTRILLCVQHSSFLFVFAKMKSQDLAPAAKSPRGAAAPSSDSPADPAELSPELPPNLEPEYQSFPIFCVSRAAPRQIIVPAVRVCRSASRWGVLPFSKQEFGSV